MTLLSDIIPNLLGPQGPQGAGFQGDQGAQGNQGAAGTNGAQGNQGDIGPQGNQGIAGTNGSQGNQGAAGAQGSQGSQGYQGLRGFQGFTGDPGPQGAQGDVGAQGNQGNQGNTGSQGVAGSQGSQGNQGFQGNQGDAIIGKTGGLSVSYLFSTATTAPPGAGEIRINADTNIYADAYDRHTSLVWPVISEVEVGDQIYIVQESDNTNFKAYTINTVTNNATYYDWAVTVFASSGSIVNGSNTSLIICKMGPAGPQGDQGSQGNQGSAGPVQEYMEISGEYAVSTADTRLVSLQFSGTPPYPTILNFYYKLELFSSPITENGLYFGKYEIEGHVYANLNTPEIIEHSWRYCDVDFNIYPTDSNLSLRYKDPTIVSNKLRLNWAHGGNSTYEGFSYRLTSYFNYGGNTTDRASYRTYFSNIAFSDAAIGSQTYPISQQIHSGLILTKTISEFEALTLGYQSYAERALDVRGDARILDELYLDTLHTDTVGYQGLLGKHTSKAVADVVVGDALNLSVSGTLSGKTYTATIGDGVATEITVTHGYTLTNATQLIIQLYEVSSGEQVFTETEAISATQVKFTFGVAPTTNQYSVIIFMI